MLDDWLRTAKGGSFPPHIQLVCTGLVHPPGTAVCCILVVLLQPTVNCTPSCAAADSCVQCQAGAWLTTATTTPPYPGPLGSA